MLAKFVTNASGILFSWRDNSSFRPYTLGPLCLWQCLLSLTSDMYEIKLPSALLSLLAGRDAEEKKNVKIYILLVYLQNHCTTWIGSEAEGAEIPATDIAGGSLPTFGICFEHFSNVFEVVLEHFSKYFGMVLEHFSMTLEQVLNISQMLDTTCEALGGLTPSMVSSLMARDCCR